MKNKRVIDEALTMMERIPEFERKAVYWLIQHMELAEQLCTADDPIPEQDLKTEIQKARETQDHVYFALLSYQNIVQK